MQTYNSFNELAAAQTQSGVSNMVTFDTGATPEGSTSDYYQRLLEVECSAYEDVIQAQNATSDPNHITALKNQAQKGWNKIKDTHDKAHAELNRNIEATTARPMKHAPLLAQRDKIVVLETKVQQLKQQAGM